MKTLALAVLLSASFAQAQPDAPTTRASPAANGTWESYKAKTRKDLDAIGEKIEKLDADAHAKGAEAGSDIRKTIDALRAEKIDAEGMLAKLETTAEADRKELKAKLDREIRQLKREYRKAVAKKPAAAH